MCKACEEHLRPCYLMKNIEGLGWEQEGSFSSSLAFAFFPKDSQKLPLSSRNVLGASLFQRFPLKIGN